MNTNFSYALINETDFSGADLEGANFEFADLSNSDLTDCDMGSSCLKYADMKNSNLDCANLEGANIKDVRNLTIGQLSKVKTLYKAKLDSELEQQIKEKYSYLLEKTKDKR